MKRRIFATDTTWMPFILRALLGVVVVAHGAQKLFGLFGGYGFSGTMDYFTNLVEIP